MTDRRVARARGRVNSVLAAGARRAPAVDVRRRLGEVPWTLWCYYREIQDDGGFVHPTIDRTAERLGLSPRRVRRAHERLSKARVLVPLGSSLSRCAKHADRVVKVYEWHLPAVVVGEFVYAPQDVAKAIDAMNQHGGARRGNRAKSLSIFSSRVAYSNTNTRSSFSLRENNDMPPPERARRSCVFSKGERVDGEMIVGQGAAVSSAWWSWVFNSMNAPPVPGDAVVPPVVIPAPPKITDVQGGGPHSREVYLAACYRSVVTRVTGKPCHTLRRGLVRSRWLATLTKAADAFQQHDVCPAVWLLWVAKEWHQRRGPKPIPMPAAFAVGRIERHHGWCLSDAYHPPARFEPQSLHKALIRRHALMMRDLRRLNGDTTPSVVRAVVERRFPAGEWEQLVDAARAEAEVAQSRVTHQARRGDWLWQ